MSTQPYKPKGGIQTPNGVLANGLNLVGTGVTLFSTEDQVLAAQDTQKVTWDTKNPANSPYINFQTSNTDILILEDGFYLFVGGLGLYQTTVGFAQMQLQCDDNNKGFQGFFNQFSKDLVAGTYDYLPIIGGSYLEAGDKVWVYAGQNSAGQLTLSSYARYLNIIKT